MNKYKQLDYQEVGGEKCWTYQLRIIFNKFFITEVTITDHYQQKKGRKMITNELILEILTKKLNRERIDPIPESYLWGHDIYRWEIPHQGQKYRLIFWFKNNTTNHLWIRNCYPID